MPKVKTALPNTFNRIFNTARKFLLHSARLATEPQAIKFQASTSERVNSSALLPTMI